MTRPRFFFSTQNAAKVLGVAVRTIGRVTERHGIQPMKFEGGMRLRHFWTIHQVREIRSHLKNV